MADDAADSVVELPETPEEAPQTVPAEGSTADAAPESEGTTLDAANKVAEDERLKFAQEYHRQQLGKAGNSVARVKPDVRQRLAERPTLIEEQEAEIAALRRALLGGPASGQVQQQASAPPKDESEERAKAFLRTRGFTGKEDNYQELLEYESSRERDFAERFAREIEKHKPDTKALAENVRKEDREAVWKEEFSEITQGPDWTDPEKGETFEGKFWRKAREIGKTRKWVPPSVLAAEIKAELQASSKSTAKPRPQMGDSSSGKVAASAGSDPFKQVDEAARSVGVDPKEFFG